MGVAIRNAVPGAAFCDPGEIPVTATESSP
jgi:hypothetical protein